MLPVRPECTQWGESKNCQILDDRFISAAGEGITLREGFVPWQPGKTGTTRVVHPSNLADHRDGEE